MQHENSKARQSKATEDKEGEYEAKQSKAGQGKTRQGKERVNKDTTEGEREERARRSKARRGKTEHGKARQWQDKAGHSALQQDRVRTQHKRMLEPATTTNSPEHMQTEFCKKMSSNHWHWPMKIITNSQALLL